MVARTTVDGAGVGRTWAGGLGVLVVVASLGWLAGPVGLAAGAAAAIAWWTLPAPYAVAAGHLAALPVLPVVADPAAFVAFEAGWLSIAGAGIVRGRDRTATFALLSVAGLGLGAIGWWGWPAAAFRWPAAAVIATIVAVGCYGLHRYAVVSLARREASPRP